MQCTLCEMPGWTKHKLESRLLGEIQITSGMQMIPPLWHKVKEESEKAGLKLIIQEMKILAYSSITSWQIDWETVQNSNRLYFLELHHH